MGMLELENDEPVVIRRRRRADPVRAGTAAAPDPTSRGPRRLAVTIVAVRPRLSGCI